MVLARGRHARNSEVELVQTLLEACGQCEEVPEAQVDIHTGLSGSGVAFVSIVWSPCPLQLATDQVGPSKFLRLPLPLGPGGSVLSCL